MLHHGTSQERAHAQQVLANQAAARQAQQVTIEVFNMAQLRACKAPVHISWMKDLCVCV